MSHQCIVCGYVYDAQQGDDSQGIPAGTPFEQLPESYLCPDCGVGKHDFEAVEG